MTLHDEFAEYIKGIEQTDTPDAAPTKPRTPAPDTAHASRRERERNLAQQFANTIDPLINR